MAISFTLFLAAVGLVGLGLTRLLRPTLDPREPRYVVGSIPYVSHMVGLSREVFRYLLRISEQVKLPVFTLPLPGAKLYVVASPQLVLAVQKLPRELAFPPVAVKFSTSISSCSQDTTDIMHTNMFGEHGEVGYSHAVHKTIREAMLPGPKLNESMRPMIGRIAYACDQLARKSPQTVNLADWLQHEVTMATAVAIWGSEHPMLDPKVERAFWCVSRCLKKPLQGPLLTRHVIRDFQDNLYGVLFGFLPEFTARRTCRARQVCIDAYHTYFKEMKHERASELAKIRYKTSREHGVSVLDIAKLEVLNIMATITNTYPAVFWMMYYVFSQPHAVTELRAELEREIVSTARLDGTKHHIVDLTRLKATCPLLLSTMQESLRMRSIGGSFRLVTQDVLLDGRYLLKKGGSVILPSLIYHGDSTQWGSDVDVFNHRRFLNLPRKRAGAFRAFGGGQHLCPGRHFATTELLAVAAMLLMRFDLVPTTADGRWPAVRAERVKLWAQLTEPEPNLDVTAQIRDCWGPNDEWEFTLSDDSDAVVRMTIEDRE